MKPKQFAFSIDRETFEGHFDTRAQAMAAGLEKAHALPDVVCVYVGEVIEADPQATDHAELILKHMNRRAAQRYGDAASDYCKKVNDQEAAMLDEAVAGAIQQWLKQTGRLPGFNRIAAVSEHPIVVPQSSAQSLSAREVSQLGQD